MITESKSVASSGGTFPTTESMTHAVQKCDLRELQTALAAFDKAEYTGGRERAAAFLAAAVRNTLVNFNE